MEDKNRLSHLEARERVGDDHIDRADDRRGDEVRSGAAEARLAPELLVYVLL